MKAPRAPSNFLLASPLNTVARSARGHTIILKKKEPQKLGRPTVFTQEIAEMVCERLKTGRTLRDVCRDEDMPAASTVQTWIEADRSAVGGFAEQYARAREIGYRTMADEILDISDDATNDWLERNGHKTFNGEHVQRSRLRVDTRKWLLSKALPKIYGDKVELSGPDGGPLVIKWAEPSDGASQQESPDKPKT